jgi:predicted amidohydrolase
VELTAVALQYELGGDFDATVVRAAQLVGELEADGLRDGLVVLPAFSFTGEPADPAAVAESSVGRTVQLLSDFAVRLRSHVVGSHVERDGDALFHTAVLLAPDGTQLGSYRQTHFGRDGWATPGEDLPVFETAIGRIGILLCEDVRFPEASAVLTVRRADLIAVPSAWSGGWGGPLQESAGLFAHGFPANTMCLWYAVAKTSQAYTIVANPVGDGYQGCSGVFTINAVDAEPPRVASTDGVEAVRLAVRTLGDPDWWMDQRRLIAGRRADLAVPAVLDPASAAFATWRERAGYDLSAWTAYAQ